VDFLHLVQTSEKLLKYLAKEAAVGVGRTALFKDCPSETMDLIVARMTRASFSAEEIIFERIDDTSPIYYVVFGKVEQTYDREQPRNGLGTPTASGMKKQKRRRFRAASLFGTDHLIKGQPVVTRAVALERTLALQIDRDDLQRLSTECPCLQKSINRVQSTTKIVLERITSKNSSSKEAQEATQRLEKIVRRVSIGPNSCPRSVSKRSSDPAGFPLLRMQTPETSTKPVGSKQSTDSFHNFSYERSNIRAKTTGTTPQLEAVQNIAGGIDALGWEEESSVFVGDTVATDCALRPFTPNGSTRRRISSKCRDTGRRVHSIPEADACPPKRVSA